VSQPWTGLNNECGCFDEQAFPAETGAGNAWDNSLVGCANLIGQPTDECGPLCWIRKTTIANLRKPSEFSIIRGNTFPVIRRQNRMSANLNDLSGCPHWQSDARQNPVVSLDCQ
jgi:hypothetical protein